MATSQVDRVHVEIRNRILEADYPSGSPLLERQLAENHDTSRTSVREALFRLQSEGFVERIPGRGCFVARPSIKQLKDTFEMRRVIEGEAAALAAQVATPEEIRELRSLANFSFRVGSHKSYRRSMDKNAQFHIQIAGASHNALAVDFVRACLQQMNLFMALGGQTSNEFEDSTAEHHRVVDAIEAGDSEAARQAIGDHLVRTRDLMMASLLGVEAGMLSSDGSQRRVAESR